MNLINELVSRYPFLMDLLLLLATLLGVIAAFWTTLRTDASRAIKERYENLIFPLFNVLEPVLFHDEPTPDIHVEMMRIFLTNKQWADGELLERFHYYANIPNPATFQKLCALVDSRYDSCCRQLGMPVRTHAYRHDKKQFKNNFVDFLYWLKPFFISLGILFITTLLYFLISLAYERFFYPSVSPFFYLAALLLLVFMVYKLILRLS